MPIRFHAALAALCVLLCASVRTEAQQDDCNNLSGDAGIAACTRDIQSGRFSGGDLAVKFIRRGVEYDGKNDLDRALADYNEAIRLDPKFAKAFNNRGIVYEEKHNRDLALADYSEAIRLDPKFVNPLILRSDFHYKNGDLDRAIADISTAIDLNPKRFSYWTARCWERALLNRDLELALADCDRSLELKPDEASTMANRGLVYLRLGRMDDAIKDLDAVLKLVPDAPVCFYFRGLAKLKKGDKTGGDADIAKAKALKADVAEYYEKYGLKP